MVYYTKKICLSRFAIVNIVFRIRKLFLYGDFDIFRQMCYNRSVRYQLRADDLHVPQPGQSVCRQGGDQRGACLLHRDPRRRGELLLLKSRSPAHRAGDYLSV